MTPTAEADVATISSDNFTTSKNDHGPALAGHALVAVVVNLAFALVLREHTLIGWIVNDQVSTPNCNLTLPRIHAEYLGCVGATRGNHDPAG